MPSDGEEMTLLQANSVKPSPPKKCYFSLIQFSPQRHRKEAVNIAVIVEAPEFGYRGAKYLRHMDSLLRCIDSLADVEMVRTYVKNIETNFRRSELKYSPETFSEPLFDQIKKPVGLDEIIDQIRSSPRLPIIITDRKPVSIPSEYTMDWKLDSLYNNLIFRPRETTRENLDKEFVRRTSISILENFIDIALDVEPISGFSYQDNEFDAAQKDENGNMVSFFEFISFDVKSPDTSQMKFFLETVEDVRKSGVNEQAGYQFHAIVQPPKHNKERENEKAYEIAVNYALKRGVPITLLEANAVAGLGQRLKRR